MTQLLTFVALAAAAWWLWSRRGRLFRRDAVRVSIRLDHSSIGAHLIWTVANGGDVPIRIRKFAARDAHGTSASLELDGSRTIEPQQEAVLAMDADWTVLGARWLALVDEDGHAYPAPRRQLQSIQQRLRQVVDRRATSRSARDFLFGAADLAFGAVILCLGFFMLMWVIATG